MSSIIMSGFFSVGITWKNFNFGSFAIRWTAWLTDSMGLQQWKQQNRRSWGHKTAGSSSKIVSPAEIKIIKWKNREQEHVPEQYACSFIPGSKWEMLYLWILWWHKHRHPFRQQLYEFHILEKNFNQPINE